MPLPADNINRYGVAASDFASTHWSVVRQAGKEHSPAAAAALERLCRTYWYPLYAFVRRQGHDAPTMPAAIQPNTSPTVMRKPRTQGRPPRLPGSRVMMSR